MNGLDRTLTFLEKIEGSIVPDLAKYDFKLTTCSIGLLASLARKE